MRSINYIYNVSDVLKNINIFHNLVERQGFVLINGVNSDLEGVNIAKTWGTISANIDANKNGITTISNDFLGENIKNRRAFSNLDLYPHTDRSPTRHPPDILFNWVVKPSLEGGESVLVDGVKIFNYLRLNNPKESDILQEKDVAMFFDGIDSFIGPIFKKKGKRISIRFRNDSCIKIKPHAKYAIECLKKAIFLFKKSYSLGVGDAYLLDNHRFLHGREKYTGERIISRVLISSRQKRGDL